MTSDQEQNRCNCGGGEVLLGDRGREVVGRGSELRGEKA